MTLGAVAGNFNELRPGVQPSDGISREICLHFPGGLESLDKPLLWMFPKVVVCLDCGVAQFAVPEAELKLIQDNLEISA